jgi:DNA/RNA-binding domain of Phe-tRNA-synthetase-like protein
MDEAREPGALIPALAPDLPPLRLGVVTARPVAVGPAGPALQAEIDETCRRLREEHSGKPPAAIPGLQPARDLYRAFGIDPTRTRPSSEALLRRVLQGGSLPRILNAVDLINLLALRFLLSIGLYDAERIRGRVVLRRGRPGEAYAGIRKEEVHLEGRPVLTDDEGPFGNPTSDSLRTSVTPETRALAMVLFAPTDLPRGALDEHVRAARAAMERHLAAPHIPVATEGTVVDPGHSPGPGPR